MRRTRLASLIAVIAALACIPIALAWGAASSPPTATTAAATNVSDNQATLNGSVNPNGQQTSYEFQWGPTTSYGRDTGLRAAGAGTGTVSESTGLSGLPAGSTYHYRILAINASGTTVGADQTFKTSGTAPTPTPAPTVKTGPASSISANGATVSGVVTPAGHATSYYFEYGPSVNYGFRSVTENAGSGTSAKGVTAGLGNLAPNTTYHYRLVAVSGNATAVGSDATFSTGAGAPAAGSRVSFIGREGFVSPGRVIGVEAACLGGNMTCTGHVAIKYGSRVLGQRDFSIAPNTGGFQNIKLSEWGGRKLVSYNHVWHLLPVTVDVTTSTGQHLTTTVHLARWIWH